MAVTLAQAQLNTQDDIQSGVIDEFRKSSYILDNIQFHQCVAPTGQGGTLTYGYTRVKTEATAATRALNAEYVAGEATKERATCDLAIFGGAYNIDRVLAKVPTALVDEVVFQTEQHVKSTRSLFHDLVINGDTATTATEFDGLNVFLTGSTTEAGTGTYVDFSTMAAIKTNAEAFDLALKRWLKSFDGRPDVFAGNSDLIATMEAVARVLGYYSQTEDAFGRAVTTYAGIPLVDLGAKPASANPVVATVTRDVDGAGAGGNITGLTDLYAWRFGMDALHGISTVGAPSDLVQVWLPQFDTAGAVKPGEVEMVAAVVLKASRAAGVFRNIKVAA